MAPSDFALTPEILLEHDRLVRSVARNLLRDGDALDDAVQDTWLRALQRGPRALRSLTGWLGRVATNCARDLCRSNVRRTAREHLVARGEAIESTATACERLEVQREVVAAILELPEPYKSVVVRRYYHDLTPTAIAAATGAKAATVRVQLMRAHDLLRARLDQRYGERKAWAVVLLPLLEGQLALPLAAPIAIAAAALGTIGAIGGGIWLAASLDSTPAPPPTVATPLAMLPEPPAADTPVADAGEATQPRSIVPQEPQAPLPARPPATVELIDARAVLQDQVTHGNYADACFSFEFGRGGSAAAAKTRNDWDISLGRDRLRVLTVTDDRGLVVDLGTRRLAALASVPLEELLDLVRGAAIAAYMPEADTQRRPGGQVDVTAGHAGFVWTLDDGSDVASLFEVVEHLPRDRCTLDWYSTEDGRLARGSLASPTSPRTLAQVAMALREAAREVRDRYFDLQQPRVLMQARVGARGGNPCRIDLARDDLSYFRRWSKERLAIDRPAEIHDEALAYREGGTIPKDKKFVVTRVRWFAIANGDSNGPGYFSLQLADQQLVDHQRGEMRGSWDGRVELARGDEARVWMEVSNSTVAEVVFEGEFQDIAR